VQEPDWGAIPGGTPRSESLDDPDFDVFDAAALGSVAETAKGDEYTYWASWPAASWGYCTPAAGGMTRVPASMSRRSQRRAAYAWTPRLATFVGFLARVSAPPGA
jgi:hypothetical protein